MPIDQQELGRRLKAAREACHFTQDGVAALLGVSRSTIAQIERGTRAVTSLELDKLAYLYGRGIGSFLADTFRPARARVTVCPNDDSAQLANYALPRLRRMLDAGSVSEAEAETMLRAVGRWL